MDKVIIGYFITIIGIVGYITGIFIKYPGRSLSITATIIGICFVAIEIRSKNKEIL